MGLVIVGAGGFGREILNVLDAADPAHLPSDLAGFVDDDPTSLQRVADLGETLLGSVSVLAELDHRYLVGIADARIRKTVDERLARLGCTASPAIRHRSALIGRMVDLGAGTVVCSLASLTTNIVCGRHLHVNIGATIGHDCVIGDFVTLAPSVNLSGNVTVGDCVEFGTGAMVLPGLSIGTGAVVGAGAVVTRDVDAGVTVVGVPARPLPRIDGDRPGSLD